jgi:hypothetical protein
MAHFVVGTKRNTFGLEFTVQSSGNTDLSRISNLFLKAQKGTSGASAVRLSRHENQRHGTAESHHFELCVFGS